MATIKDVAQVAGVSVTTVSRVINDRGYISSKTKKQVYDAMQKLDYYPNDLARALNQQRSSSIGLIIPTVAHPFFAEMAQEMEACAYNNGYKLIICNSQRNIDKEREYITMLRRNQVDGIIMGSQVQEVEDYVGLRLPLVTIDREISGKIPYVCCDNYAGGELATKHLIEHGCKKLIYICGNLNIVMLSNQRARAFQDTCEADKVQYKICELPDTFTEQEEEAAKIMKILKENPDCDGIFTSGDSTAALVIQAAASMGKSVPEDIKVVGFDGSRLFRMFNPSITSVRQPVEMISKYAIQYLISQLKGEAVPSKTILPVELLAGGSS